jgi:hypothetical protein
VAGGDKPDAIAGKALAKLSISQTAQDYAESAGRLFQVARLADGEAAQWLFRVWKIV